MRKLLLTLCGVFAFLISQNVSAQVTPPAGWGDFQMGLVNDNSNIINVRMKQALSEGVKLSYRYAYVNNGVDPNTNALSWLFNQWGTDYSKNSSDMGLHPGYVIYMLQEEGGAAALKNNILNTSFMQKYFLSIRTVAEKSNGYKAIFVIEPDTWGYFLQNALEQGLQSDPQQIPANVNNLGTGYEYLSDLPNTLSGVAQAIIRTIHKYAPDSYCGLLMSFWDVDANGATGPPVADGSKGMVYWSQSDVDYSANRNVTFANQLLGTTGDRGNFIGVEKNGWSAGNWLVKQNRDDYYWNDTQNAKWISWSKTLRTGVNLPLLGWQISIGHMGLPNTVNRYEDTFMPYFFGHVSQYIDAGFIGFLAGKGLADCTDFTNLHGNSLEADGSAGDDGWYFEKLKVFDASRPYLGSVVGPSASITSPANNSTFMAGATITINANASAGTNCTATKVEFFQGSVKLGEDLTSPYSYAWTNVAEGTYTLTAKITNSCGATATSAAVVVSVTTPNILPSPWVTSDIGAVAAAGSASYSNGTFTLGGSGADIWNAADEFRYVYQTLNGNGAVIAKVNSLTNTNGWAKAGVMIRESLAANSTHASTVITPSNGISFQQRTTTDGTSTSVTTAGQTVPKYLKIERSGTTFTSSYSTDGVSYTVVGTTNISMANTVQIGLCVTSHSDGVVATADFSNVSITSGNVAPTVSITSPVNGTVFSVPASITINATASDPDGSVSKVDFYNGTTLLGTDTSSPYSLVWTGMAAGNYTVTAKATDNAGATTTSGAVSITVTNAYAIPGTIEAENWSAMSGVQTETTTDAGAGLNVGWIDAGDWMDYNVNVSSGGAYNVAFRVASQPGGGQLQLKNSAGTVLATVNIAATGGWQTWVTLNTTATLATGNQTLRVFASAGGWNLNWMSFTSGNASPTASITSPTNGASFTAPACITINANATDSDGTIAKVEFYNGATKIGEDATSPYSFTWCNVAAGSYSLTAKAIDNLGAVGSSTAISVTVTGSNSNPTTSITSPANNTSFTAPASVTINATASDSDGTVAKVEFFNGSTLLGSDTSSPFSFSWTNVAAGTYTLTAKATDNAGGTGTSPTVTIVVNSDGGSCASIPQYVENGGYVAGSVVKNVGNQYECKPWPYSGWCNGGASAYAPGTGTNWTDAWTLKGSCTARAAQTESEEITREFNSVTIFPNPGAANKEHEVTLIFDKEAGHVALQLINTKGTSIMQNNYRDVKTKLHIAMPVLTAGLYLIRIRGDHGTWVEKYMIHE